MNFKLVPSKKFNKEGKAYIGVERVYLYGIEPTSEWVQVYYDEENKLLGVKPTRETEIFARRLRKKRRGYVFQLAGFFEKRGIERGYYPLEWNEELSMYIISLGKALNKEE